MAMEKRSPSHRWDYSYHVVTKIDENVPVTLYIKIKQSTLFVNFVYENLFQEF